MHHAARRRSLTAAVATLATVPLALCSSTVATADPAGTPTAFQVPLRFVAGCSFEIMECWGLPPLSTVIPSATPIAPGAVTFTAAPATRVLAQSYDCVDMWVHWRNLTTGATGTTVLERIPVDHARTPPPYQWCEYPPATADTGAGTVVATADIVTFGFPPAAYRIVVTPGVGTFHVP